MAGIAQAGRVAATAIVRGRRRVIGHGRIRHHVLTITFKRLHRGRYRVTLLELRAHRAAEVIGQTTIVVT
jgi:hypothetical protein